MYLERKEIGMKKIACVLVMACVITAGAFAQQKPGASAPAASGGGGGGGSSAKVFKNSIGMDVVPLFTGIINYKEVNDRYKYSDFRISFSYERLIVPHFSIGPDVDMWYAKLDNEKGKDPDFFYLCIAGEGRYYPSANFDKLFFGAALGFNVFSNDGKTKEEDGGYAGLFVAIKTGYKVITSKGFYMEPSLSYVLSEPDNLPALLGSLGYFGAISGTSTKGLYLTSGWNVGLRLGFSF